MRNVLITGGSRGIGLAIARTLHSAGYRVIALARTKTTAVTEAIEQSEFSRPNSFHFISFDLSQTDKIPELIRNIRKEFGDIYGLVNNAAISHEGPLALLPVAEIEKVLHTNVLAPIILTKFAVRSMLAGGSGRVINMSSIVAHSGFSGLSVYAASKASLIGFTRSLAREIGTAGITVNAVSPGPIETEMMQGASKEDWDKIIRRSALRRLTDVDDIAHAVEFLLSEHARNITGTVLTVDAGSTA